MNAILEKSLFHPVKIGSLELEGNLFLAPAAGYSDSAFRSVCAGMGAAFAYTEMVSAEALARGSGKTENLMARAKGEKKYAVQLFGSNPAAMERAAQIVLERTDANCIDINAGCPVNKIVKTGSGAALTKDYKALFLVVKAAVLAAKRSAEAKGLKPVPVTIKIRAGWDESCLTWKEAAFSAFEAGAAAVTLHPRTRAQGYEGKANWELIAKLKEAAVREFPNALVFGSGDLFSPEDALSMLSQTACDAVMFARGAMGNPFIFKQALSLLQGGKCIEVSDTERIKTAWQEFLLLKEALGERSACLEIRKRFCAYTRGLRHSANLREQLVGGKTEADFRKIFESAGYKV